MAGSGGDQQGKKEDFKVLTVTCSHWKWLKVSHLHDLINQTCCVMDPSSVALAGAIGIRNKRSSGDRSYLTVLLFSFLPSPSLYNNNNNQKAHPHSRFFTSTVCRSLWHQWSNREISYCGQSCKNVTVTVSNYIDFAVPSYYYVLIWFCLKVKKHLWLRARHSIFLMLQLLKSCKTEVMVKFVFSVLLLQYH